MRKHKPLTPWEKEWKRLIAREKQFLSRKPPNAAAILNQRLEKHIPEKLQATLDTAFYKAFQLIFTKGTGIIEKTYDREKRSADYKIKSYAADIRGNEARSVHSEKSQG